MTPSYADKSLIRACALLFLVGSINTGANAGELLPELIPDPGLTAGDVVRIQLDALADNDSPHPDAGIEITFRFASPGNKEITGPLPKFIALVKNPIYRPMINHTDAAYGQSLLREGQTLLPVVLTAIDGSKAGYVFVLGQHDLDSCKSCWMTESVMRIRVGDAYVFPQKEPATGI